MTTPKTPDPEHRHLTPEALQDFLCHTEEPEERSLLYHLLACCEACRRAAHPLLELYRTGVVDGRTSPLEIELAVSEWHAPKQWDAWEEELLAGADTSAEKLERLRGEPGWPTWGLVAWLARRSRETAEDDPETAVAWGRLAVSGAARLRHVDPAPEEWNMELRAFAQAALGNAQRAQGDLEAAEATFATARKALEAYAADPPDFLPYRARTIALEATLRRDQGRTREALDLLDEALEAWELVCPPQPEERARVAKERVVVVREIDDPSR